MQSKLIKIINYTSISLVFLSSLILFLSIQYPQILKNKFLIKNINIIGSCCGTEAHHIREMAVALGRKPISKKYMPDMKKHFHFGNDEKLKDVNTKYDY